MTIELGVLSFLTVLMIISFTPLLSHRIRLPVIIVEIIMGILFGQSFLKIIVQDPWLDFFSFFGLIYLLFLAGLDIDFHHYKGNVFAVLLIAGFSLLIPFYLGYEIGQVLSINPFLLGVLLCTTSVGVVIPLTKELGNSGRFATVLLGSTMVVDVVSMFLLTFALETAKPNNFMYWPYLVFIILFIIPFLLRQLKVDKVLESWSGDKTHFQFEVRICFALIAIFVLVSEFIGVHAILGAFIAGLIVSELTHKGGELEKKLQSFGYGFFTPFFFTIAGALTDIPALIKNSSSIGILLAVLVLGIIGKVVGSAFPSLISGFSKKESIAMGFIHSARLSLILAGATIAKSMGIINIQIYSSLILFAIISVIIGPTVGMFILKKKTEAIKYYPEIPEELWT